MENILGIEPEKISELYERHLNASLKNACDFSPNDEKEKLPGLTQELIKKQFEKNWNYALEITRKIIENPVGEYNHFHIQGEMGSGKTQITLMIIELLQLAEYKNQTHQFGIGGDRDFHSRADTEEKSNVIGLGFDGIDVIIEKIVADLGDSPAGNVVFLSEIQFLIQAGDSVEDMTTNAFRNWEKLSSKLTDLGVIVVTDTLTTFASGKLIPATKVMQHFAGTDNTFIADPVNVINPETPADINMRFVQIYEDGNLVFPDIDKSETGKLASMDIDARLKLINKLKEFIDLNPELGKFFFEYDESLGIRKYKIPIHPDDIAFMPGGVERYVAVDFSTVRKILTAIGWRDATRLYRRNILQSKKIDKCIAQLAA